MKYVLENAGSMNIFPLCDTLQTLESKEYYRGNYNRDKNAKNIRTFQRNLYSLLISRPAGVAEITLFRRDVNCHCATVEEVECERHGEDQGEVYLARRTIGNFDE